MLFSFSHALVPPAWSFLTENVVDCLVAADWDITTAGMAKARPVWSEIEVSSCPDVLEQTNVADGAHEHEGFTAVDAQHSFEQLPVCLRQVSIVRLSITHKSELTLGR